VGPVALERPRRFWTVLAAVAVTLTTAVPPTRVSGQDPGVRMVPVEGEAAQYWTRWRGPSGQGVVGGAGYTDRWSPTENVRWKIPVPGEGNSSPIVWRDQIFLTTAHPDGLLAVLSFRRTDGTKQWETVVPARPGRAHQKNGYASATVATDGARVYASFGSELLALSIDGKIVWRQPLGAIANYHGPAGSPLLYKDRVIVYQDQSRGSFIAAFDAATGKQVWRTARQATIGWGTPVAVRMGSQDEVIVSSEGQVQSYNPMTGAEIWSCRGSTYEVIPTPVVGAGLIFCSSGRAGPTLAIKPGGKGDVTRSHLAWSSPRGSPFVPSPILVGDQLYMVNDMASIVTSFDAVSGRTLWQGRLGVANREGFSASPVAFDGKVFFTNDDGETFVLRAGRTFELLHVNRIGERTLASPALVDGRWYLRTDRHLWAIGAK
jgi:outer membrane protein assembly factor BamB